MVFSPFTVCTALCKVPTIACSRCHYWSVCKGESFVIHQFIDVWEFRAVCKQTLRHGSLCQIEIDMSLKLSNYEDTVRQLDVYYGLGPRWAVSRRIDDDRGKSYELGQSAVKCMRGILECWIKQAPRIELFKKNQCNKHALHCKFHLTTGAEVYNDEEYYHLQIDVVSLYLIFLVQMITSGLQIIYTQDEVAFVQNLVYYVERAYRTPDYGMWERGSKYNDGTPEIHARQGSIGMAKSALEAINGCNLFGEKGASWSVIYVDIDAHNRNRSIFETMLPRESSSKGVDASLIPTISFPAFATHEEVLCVETKANVVHRLKGCYGFKRFCRDGYKCVLEDSNRRHYRNGETKEFEGIECEWPLFYMFMIIDGVFKAQSEQIEEYQNLLKSKIKRDINGDPVIPMYFYVHESNIEFERQEPGSQIRLPSGEGSGVKGMFLWNQAMFVIAQLLTAGLLHINELDPIRRYLPSYNRPRKGGRYSAFQVSMIIFGRTATDLVVQIVLIAESMRLQAMMATYGIQTQTPHEVEPVQIWSSRELVKVYRQLGVNSKLGLNGRPARPIGALGTSKVYRVCGMTVLCYPLIFEVSEFYLYRDMALLIDDIKTELQFVGRYWRLSGRPTVCLLIREEHMRDPHFKEMLDLLAMLKKGYCDGMKVRIGRLQNLISSSCIGKGELGLRYPALENKPLHELLDTLRSSEGVYARCQLYGMLLKREGLKYEFNGLTVEDHLKNLYHHAGCLRYWVAVRYCSSLLHHTVDSISPFITTVLVNGKQLTVGVTGQQETVFDKPMTPAEIQSVIYSTIQPYDVIQAVLQQEVVLYCGRLIATNPEMFKGILKIRVGWVLEAMKIYLQMTSDSKPLENHSPYEVRQLLHKVLSVREWATRENLTPLQRRRLEGCLCRVPIHFYVQVWDVMSRTPQGVTVQGSYLPQNPTLSNMTQSELNFALLVEEMLNHIQKPEYRQTVVELLCIVSTILTRNPELTFRNQLDLDHLVNEAFLMYCKDNKIENQEDLTPFFSTHYSMTTGYLARAVVNNVLQGGQFATGSHNDNDIGQEEPCRIS
ncbi:hypothetical protein Cfor_00569 [Coptotermes formosanus]|uniref:Phosphorylase b kinase regulatory subunit n=1 Tax=Coptotermes formosanus TaxID=36987 RepID=A0A6L2Q9T1_COPFO|nr:hypothetical protein Cfor_00569 [Coptotermes formosanus]